MKITEYALIGRHSNGDVWPENTYGVTQDLSYLFDLIDRYTEDKSPEEMDKTYAIKIYSVDEDGEFIYGCDYDTISNFYSRMNGGV